jgi:hypothetical protein
MALSAAEYQAQVPSDVGQTGNLTLVNNVPIWWELNDDRGYDLKVQYLYTLKTAIFWLIGNNWSSFDWAEGDVQRKESQKIKGLLLLLDLINKELAGVEIGSGFITYGKILAGGRDDPEIVASYPHSNPDPVWDTP